MYIGKIVAAGVAALLLTTAAQAINVSIWLNQQAAAEDATIARAATLGTPDAVLTNIGPINYRENSDSASSTLADFLNNPAGLSAAVGGQFLNNTYFLFTGSTYLNAGMNSFVVPHDDGLQLTIDGIAGFVVDEPGPTGEVTTPFNVNAPTAGFYDFTLSYGECCGGPAVLRFDVNGAPAGGVPEPETWALMVAGFGLVGASLRRRSTKAVVAA